MTITETVPTVPTAPTVEWQKKITATATFSKGTLARMVAAVKHRPEHAICPAVSIRIDATETSMATDDLTTRRTITIYHDNREGNGAPVAAYTDLRETITAAKTATSLTVDAQTVTFGSPGMQTAVDTVIPEGGAFDAGGSRRAGASAATQSAIIPLAALIAAHKTAAVDPARPTISSVLIDKDGDQTFLVSTDSYRLLALGIDTSDGGTHTAAPYLIPIEAVTAALKIAKALKADTVTVAASAETECRTITMRMVSAIGAGTVETKETQGDFPPYRKIIPPADALMPPVIVEQYRNVLNSMGKSNMMVAITPYVNNLDAAAVTLESPDNVTHHTLADMPAPDSGTGAGWPAGYATKFRASFLVDAMPPAPAPASLRLNVDPYKPALVTWDEAAMTGFGLIMPIRLP